MVYKCTCKYIHNIIDNYLIIIFKINTDYIKTFYLIILEYFNISDKVNYITLFI